MNLVTVVVNTMNRPAEVVQALGSVFAQTYARFEVIVVIDGPEPVTEKAVQDYRNGLPDPLRMRVIVNETNQGLAESRNIASREANGKWIAFLDDDDRWLPDKLKCQAAVAENLAGDFSLIVSRFIIKRDSEDEVAPPRLAAPGEDLSEYMFCNRGNLAEASRILTGYCGLRRIRERRLREPPRFLRYTMAINVLAVKGRALNGNHSMGGRFNLVDILLARLMLTYSQGS